MKTFYIIMCNGNIIAAGRDVRYTSSLNYAKHFTSMWSAQQFMNRNCCGSGWYIKKICHQ